MNVEPNAVELTVDHAWFIAETIGAGSFPWVLAITAPYRDVAQRSAFFERERAELTRMGLWEPDGSKDGGVNPAIADWIRVVCFPDRWLDLRYLGPVAATGAGELLRGVVAQRAGSIGGTGKTPKTVVALLSAQLITFTAIDIDDPRALVPVLGVGLAQRPPASFDEFSSRRASEHGPTSGCDPANRCPKSLTTWVSRHRHGRWWSRCSPVHAATSRSSPAATATGSTPPPRSG
jgi:hypothetical protein